MKHKHDSDNDGVMKSMQRLHDADDLNCSWPPMPAVMADGAIIGAGIWTHENRIAYAWRADVHPRSRQARMMTRKKMIPDTMHGKAEGG